MFNDSLAGERIPQKKGITVSQLTAKIKGLLEVDVGEVWVRGEISGLKPSAAGHLYFSLKDDGAVLSCAFFSAKSRLRFELKDGLEVLVYGKISVYPPRGNYQLIVAHAEPLGHGSLQLAFEQLKSKLEKEGLFSQEKKRPLPAFPDRVAIITSPTGAAIQDMLNVLQRRNSGISILIVPALVQGEGARDQICSAIEVVNKFHLADVLIVARGGGSIEDLWSFNEEKVVRALASSEIPSISAVGHEIDFTLCDFAADLRAPTPSAAAELVSRNRVEVLDQISGNERRLALVLWAKLSSEKSRVLALESKLLSPVERLVRIRQEVSQFEMRLKHSIENKFPTIRQFIDEALSKISWLSQRRFEKRKAELGSITARLEALSPLKVLGRGYTLIQDPKSEKVFKSIGDLESGDEVSILFHDGKVRARCI